MQVQVSRDGGLDRQVSYTNDIGTGGLSLIGHDGLSEGEEVTVHLSTPSTWEPLELRARVCWIRASDGTDPTGVGLSFVHLDRERLVALDEFVASLDFVS